MAMLQNVASSAGLDHEWDKQTQHSYLQFDESLWSKLLEQLGFGILLFAKGSFLKDLQDEARLRFQKEQRLRLRMILKSLVALRIGALLLRTVECSVHSTVMRTYQGRSMSLCTFHPHRLASRPRVMYW